jgi:hypothetical protein
MARTIARSARKTKSGSGRAVAIPRLQWWAVLVLWIVPFGFCVYHHCEKTAWFVFLPLGLIADFYLRRQARKK